MHNNQKMGQNYECRLRHFAELRQFIAMLFLVIGAILLIMQFGDTGYTQYQFAQN